MLPGLLPCLLPMIPHADPWGLPLIGIVIAVSIGTVTYAILRERDFARPEESLWHHSVLGYSAPVVALLLWLPGRAELGLMTLGVLAFGDGSAALGGKLWGGPRLPWNAHKTWAGLASFVVAGTAAATMNYWIDARPAVPVLIALMIGGSAAVGGAFVESLPIRTHDNFRVGITAALIGVMMQFLLLGW
jgi:dolichol kinase